MPTLCLAIIPIWLQLDLKMEFVAFTIIFSLMNFSDKTLKFIVLIVQSVMSFRNCNNQRVKQKSLKVLFLRNFYSVCIEMIGQDHATEHAQCIYADDMFISYRTVPSTSGLTHNSTISVGK